jgi:hypothetical protein
MELGFRLRLTKISEQTHRRRFKYSAIGQRRRFDNGYIKTIPA